MRDCHLGIPAQKAWLPAAQKGADEAKREDSRKSTEGFWEGAASLSIFDHAPTAGVNSPELRIESIDLQHSVEVLCQAPAYFNALLNESGC